MTFKKQIKITEKNTVKISRDLYLLEFIASNIYKQLVFITRMLAFRISWSPEKETLKTQSAHTKILLVEALDSTYIVKPTNTM